MIGYALSVAQMVLLVAMIWPPVIGWSLMQPFYVWLFLAAGAAIALWALVHNRPGNFNVHPEVKHNATLIQSGPYKWVRHPMYTSLIVGCFGVVLATPEQSWKWGIWGVLVLTLAWKSVLEERFLKCVFHQYVRYQATTWRLIPWVW